MTRARLRAAAVAMALALGGPGAAQDAALVADAIAFDPATLVAEGNVEVAFGTRVLRARRLTYLRDEDRLIVEGPLTLVDDGGRTIVLAEFASLRSDFRDAILRGARVVLDRRVQIAADAVLRDADGRATELRRAVASSCEVCADDPVPLWQIRARRVVNDELRRRLTFEDARFEVVGIPVAWFPRLSLPAPGVERMSGVLTPRLVFDGALGTGVVVPYFVTLGQTRDLTLSPFLTNRGTAALNLRYRQAFEAGRLEVRASGARDDLRPDDLRGHLSIDGRFRLPRGYRLRFDLEAVTDDTYLRQYDIRGGDRLESRVAVSRVERDDRVLAEAIALRTMRRNERSDELPSRVLTVTREQRRDLLGGIGFWLLEAHGRERPLSDVPDGVPDGTARDVARLSAVAGWQRSRMLPGGILLTGFAEAHLDHFEVRQDDAFDASTTRFVPYLGAQARLPLVRRAGGVRETLEPVVQVVLAPDDVADTPNEDSLAPELDDGNVLSTGRFPGRDRRETGDRASVGLSYARIAPSGWRLDGHAGRIFRWDDDGSFEDGIGTGIGGTASDWLVSLGVGNGRGFEVMTRSLFDEARVARSETILRWAGERHRMETRYTYLEKDPAAGRPRDTSEWRFDGRYDIRRDWTALAGWRYDFEAEEATTTELGLRYRTECVTVAMDVERRFGGGGGIDPTTRFGLSVELAGFGSNDGARRRRRCGT